MSDGVTKSLLRSRPTVQLNARQLLAEFRLIPNLVSLLRIALIAPIALLYGKQTPLVFGILLALLIVAYLSDYVDGYLARRLKQQSRLGLILDPLADKLWTAGMLILMAHYRAFPVWILCALVGRDVAIMALNVRCMRFTGSAMASDEVGRKYMVLLGLMIIGYTLSIDASIWLAYLLLIFAVITLYRYYRNYTRALAAFNLQTAPTA